MGCCINWCHYNWVQLLIILTSVYIAWHEGLKLSLGSISMSRQWSSLSSLFTKFNTWPWTKNVMYYVAVISVSKIECSLKYKFIADGCLTCQMWPDVIRHMWITGKYTNSDTETFYFKVGHTHTHLFIYMHYTYNKHQDLNDYFNKGTNKICQTHFFYETSTCSYMFWLTVSHPVKIFMKEKCITIRRPTQNFWEFEYTAQTVSTTNLSR
jgi:hypothetical protein